MKQSNYKLYQKCCPRKDSTSFYYGNLKKIKLVAWPTTSVLIATSLYLITSGNNIGQMQKE